MFPVVSSAALIGEGELIAASAVRLAVTNRAVVRLLRDGDQVDLDWYRTAVRAQLRTLSQETVRDATRVTDAITNYVEPPMHPDLRPPMSEIERLRRRQEVLGGLARQLLLLATRRGYVTELARACQSAASLEIADAISRTARRSADQVNLSEPERVDQLVHLRLQISEALITHEQRHAPPPSPPVSTSESGPAGSASPTTGHV